MFDLTVADLLVAITSLTVVALLVVLGQFLYATDYISGEYARKFIHMLSAVWVASWMFFMDKPLVIAIGIFLILGAFVARNLRHLILKIPRKNLKGKRGVTIGVARRILLLLDAVYAVRRPTYGEVSYGVGITLAALLSKSPEVFALSVVNLGFADGLAAVVGTKYGKNRFKIFGCTKSTAGTYACFAFAVASGYVFWKLVDTVDINMFVASLHIVLAALVITCLELIGRRGLDNILIPVATAVMYSMVI